MSQFCVKLIWPNIPYMAKFDYNFKSTSYSFDFLRIFEIQILYNENRNFSC